MSSLIKLASLSEDYNKSMGIALFNVAKKRLLTLIRLSPFRLPAIKGKGEQTNKWTLVCVQQTLEHAEHLVRQENFLCLARKTKMPLKMCFVIVHCCSRRLITSHFFFVLNHSARASRVRAAKKMFRVSVGAHVRRAETLWSFFEKKKNSALIHLGRLTIIFCLKTR